MLNPEEQGFVNYWRANRLRRKKVFQQLALGLPLGVILAVGIFANFFSGWYKKAEMVRNKEIAQHQSSLLLVLLVAVLLIVVFIVIFSVRHKWDINEQRYRELLSREGIPE